MNQFFERRYVIGGIFIALILILIGRLFYIQIIDDRYELYAHKNVIRQVIQYPARGPILDRNGIVMVTNALVYDVSVIPREVKPFDTLEFCKLLGIDTADFNKRLIKAKKYSPNLQSPFYKQISPQLFASLQERLSEFPGFRVDPHPIRVYPDSTAAQFLGYIGEITQAKLEKLGNAYHLGDYIGITGVEASYEKELRGQRGIQNKIVDSRGIPKGSYADGAYDTLAVPGERLTSSLDSRIQKLGEKLMTNKVGSIVAIEPSTGEILCFVSSPTYDPNLMIGGPDRGTNYKILHNNPYDPFNVRPIMGTYPPGSSFKPLSALIALQEGIITPQTTYLCPGRYLANRGKPKCTHVHGLVNLSSAIAESCNGYFAMVFEKLINAGGYKNTEANYTKWRKSVMNFGLAQKLHLDLPGERAGGLPVAEFYDKYYRKGGWRSSTILSLAIGQGEVDATPLQMANMECIIANHGFYYKPHLIKSIGAKKIIKDEYLVKNNVGINPEYFEPVINGMQSVVDYGTAHGSKIPGITMVGKTGTAQKVGQAKNNSVFVAYAPRENPKIAICVVVENSGDGGTWAAPIASFIVEKYLKDSITRRESGIFPEYYINANHLPEVKVKDKAKAAKADSIRKVKADSVKKIKLKSAQTPARKTGNMAKVFAMLPNQKDDE
ncbi:MAG: penicillin-binding protein 2 [Bacteroidota bacterium]